MLRSRDGVEFTAPRASLAAVMANSKFIILCSLIFCSGRIATDLTLSRAVLLFYFYSCKKLRQTSFYAAKIVTERKVSDATWRYLVFRKYPVVMVG